MRLLCMVIGLFAALAQAQTNYPTRAVKVIVPQPAGGGYDKLARVMGEFLQEHWGQPVVVENRPGANGIIGTDMTAKAPPDGYTIMLGGIGPHGVNPALYKTLPYDAIKDFAPIVLVSSSPNLLAVQPESGVRTVQELIAVMKTRQDRPLTYASSGNGSSTHLAAEMFAGLTGVKLVHVPYKGSAPMVTALLGKQVDISFVNVLDLLPHVKAGMVRALATGGTRRILALPDVPTIAEAGVPGGETSAWFGFYAPARTPREIVAKLNLDINKAIDSPRVRSNVARNGDVEMFGGSPEVLADFTRAEIAKWTKVIRDGNISQE